ncbi:hypothetical protein [Novipirellula sp.]|uniref:hypothetical protein n=1 Tax=Novipirellula sp. TaxID=2795430 RepID=UPI003568B483
MKFDLEALAAPIAAQREEVIEAYKTLEAEWAVISAKLKKLAIPCKISICIDQYNPGDDDGLYLEWRRYKGEKQFCLTGFHREFERYGDDLNVRDIEDITPYSQWSAEQKLDNLHYVKKLLECAPKQIERFVKRAKANG